MLTLMVPVLLRLNVGAMGVINLPGGPFLTGAATTPPPAADAFLEATVDVERTRT